MKRDGNIEQGVNCFKTVEECLKNASFWVTIIIKIKCKKEEETRAGLAPGPDPTVPRDPQKGARHRNPAQAKILEK